MRFTSPTPATVRCACLKETNTRPKGQIELGSDADNVRVDAATNRIFIGYGSGALAVIDPATRSKIADIPVKAHPEGFQIDSGTGQIFVNVPDAHGIAVVDRASQKQTGQWPIPDHGANFPMALDPVRRRVLAAFRAPAELGVFSMTGGKLIATAETCGDADDLFIDAKRGPCLRRVAGPALSMFWKRRGRSIGSSRVSPRCPAHARRCSCPNLTVCWWPSGPARPSRQPSGCSDRYLDRRRCRGLTHARETPISKATVPETVSAEQHPVAGLRWDFCLPVSIGRFVCLAGKSAICCPAPFAKIFCFPCGPNHLFVSRHPVPNEGRFAIVTDVGCGMRWTRGARETSGADADGEVVWS